MYRYESRHVCIENSNNCGSQYLRCDWNQQRCIPVVMRSDRVDGGTCCAKIAMVDKARKHTFLVMAVLCLINDGLFEYLYVRVIF